MLSSVPLAMGTSTLKDSKLLTTGYLSQISLPVTAATRHGHAVGCAYVQDTGRSHEGS